MIKKFKISVITVCLNSERTIERCIKSIINQKYDKSKIEHIIIDGKSRDSTVKIIKKYKTKITYWESKKDKGIYHAMNKGIRKAKGDIIGILNADDFYYKNTFKIVNKYFINKKIDYLFGSINHKKIYHSFYPEKIWYKLNVVPSHSVSFFIKKKSQFKIGLYDSSFKYSADRDLFYRLFNSNQKGIATKRREIFGKFDINGLSSKLSYFEILKEEFKVRHKNKQNIIFLFGLLIAVLAHKIIMLTIKKK